MKTTKNKLNNNKSFITNQDLLEKLRNRSFVAPRSPSQRLHTQKSKISLLKKKSFERLNTPHQNIENISCIANSPAEAFSIPTSDKAITLLQDVLSGLGEQHQKIHHKLKKVLNYVREMVEERNKQQQRNKNKREEAAIKFNKQIEKQRQEKEKLKRFNQQLGNKLAEYREKIISIRKQYGITVKQEKQPSGLQQIIINQSQIIDQQCDEYHQQGNELRRLLKVQALQIEDFLHIKHQPKHHSEKQDSNQLRQYTSLSSSFLLKH